jgi:curved DNA-binding protein CbpA
VLNFTDPGSDPAKLRAFAEGLKNKTHFEVLGLTEAAVSSQIKSAYIQLAKIFHPDTVNAGASAEERRWKADIFAQISEAHGVLGDGKLRAAYLDELKHGSEKMDASNLFDAEKAFERGCILVKAGKYAEAVKVLSESIELNEKEGEFHAWLGWAQYLAASDKKAAKVAALREIEAGINLNPKCAQSYYLAGQIAKLTGDASGALRWFKKAVEANPGHIDSQREIRLASRK